MARTLTNFALRQEKLPGRIKQLPRAAVFFAEFGGWA